MQIRAERFISLNYILLRLRSARFHEKNGKIEIFIMLIQTEVNRQKDYLFAFGTV